MSVVSLFPEVLTDSIQTETKDLQSIITQVCIQMISLLSIFRLQECLTSPVMTNTHCLLTVVASALISEMEAWDNSGDYLAIRARVVTLAQVVRMGNNINLDPNSYLSLIYLAKTRPHIFRQDCIWRALVTFLGPSRYKRGCVEVCRNLYVLLFQNLVCHLLYAGWKDQLDWPIEFIQAYLEDALGDRAWVDEDHCSVFTQSVLTIFVCAVSSQVVHN
jgi:hypothetical protein